MYFSLNTIVVLTAYLVSFSAVNGLPFAKRQVPQEHSHRKYLIGTNEMLNLDNPDGIVDSVFGLLGNAAASTGAGKISDPDCLHQATADRAFTNAKKAGNVKGMVDSLVYAALERNTLAVGQKSVLCTAIPAVNPEIGALSQHQDAASDGAAEINKAITLELARQIAKVGGDPLLALDAGTFAPGQIGDPTARGNSCNDDQDDEGCIFTLGLLVPDATPEEIQAAVADVAAPTATDAGVTATPTAAATETACPTDPVTVTVTVGAGAEATQVAEELTATATDDATPAPAATEAPAAGDNLQTFTEALGGVVAPTVTVQGTQFCVADNACFNNRRNAIVRSCDVQNNKCANASNTAGQAKEFSVGDCNQQQARCIILADSTA